MRCVAIVAALSLVAVPALAEPVPLPSVDYVASGNMGNRGTLTVRHHGDKLRTDMQMAAMPVPTLIIVDLKTHKAVIHMPLPGVAGAMEVDLGDAGGLGPVAGEGTKSGTATVGGEPCDLWQMTSRKTTNELTACITADGIHLRTEVTVEGTRQVLMEMTEVKREAQDPGLFELPPGIPIIRQPGAPSPAPNR